MSITPLHDVPDRETPADLAPHEATCHQCLVPLESGMIVDRGHFNFASQQEWTNGPSEPWLWCATSRRDGKRLRVMTLRCPRCGFLQAYAPPTADERDGPPPLHQMPVELQTQAEHVHWLCELWVRTVDTSDEAMVLHALRTVLDGSAPDPITVGPLLGPLADKPHRRDQPHPSDLESTEAFRTTLLAAAHRWHYAVLKAESDNDARDATYLFTPATRALDELRSIIR